MAISDFLLQNGWMFSLSPRPDCELKLKKKIKILQLVIFNMVAEDYLITL